MFGTVLQNGIWENQVIFRLVQQDSPPEMEAYALHTPHGTCIHEWALGSISYTG